MYSYGCGQFEWLRIHAQVVGAAGVAAALGAVPNPPAAALGAVPNPPAAGGNNVKRASHANRLMVGCMQWLCMRMLCLRVLSMCVGGGVRGVSVCVWVWVCGCVCVGVCVCVLLRFFFMCVWRGGSWCLCVCVCVCARVRVCVPCCSCQPVLLLGHVERYRSERANYMAAVLEDVQGDGLMPERSNA